MQDEAQYDTKAGNILCIFKHILYTVKHTKRNICTLCILKHTLYIVKETRHKARRATSRVMSLHYAF